MKKLLFIFSAMMIALTGCDKNNGDKNIQGADLKAGDAIPSFEVVMNDGSVVSDEDLKGKVSVVMFFHTSCPDCQQALPRVQQVYDEYASKGVIFVLISREEGVDDIEAFWKEKGLNMPYSPQNSRKEYHKFAQGRIPRIYMNDENRIIRYTYSDNPVPTYDQLKSSLVDLTR